MSSSIDNIKDIFEYELKIKLSERARNIVSEYRTLLNCFKYYDIKDEGELDKSKWIKAILKTGLNGFSENELGSIFNNYTSNNLDKIDYKDFCNYLYKRDRTDSLSKTLTNNNKDNYNNNIINTKNYLYNSAKNLDFNQYNKKYEIKQNNGYGNDSENKNNVYKNRNNNYYNNYNGLKNDNESIINDIKDKIHIDNGVVYYSFLKFLNINEEPTSHKISLEDLSVTFQELHLKITSEEIHNFFNLLDIENDGRIPTENIINLIKEPLDNKRKACLNEIYSNLDTEKKGEISVNTLKNIYNYRNHPDVLEGKKTPDEIYNKFCYTLDVYIRINNILNNSINNEQFIEYYSGISPSIKNNDDFQNILEKVWIIDSKKNKYMNRRGYNYSDDNFDNNDIGINSIFLGVSHSKRPKYDYNYDYLEEFSKSSPNLIQNKITNNKRENKTILNYSNNSNNENTFRNTLGNKNLINHEGNSLNDDKKINQTVNNSDILKTTNFINDKTGKKRYFNYESKKDPEYKGIKVFKKKRYNPITDEFIQDNYDISINNTSSSNLNTQEFLNQNQTPNKNLYTNNKINQNNSENNHININELINSKEIKENKDIIENLNQTKSEVINNTTSLNIKKNKILIQENKSLIQFRNLLISRGNKSIFRFQRMLSIYDRNHSGLISFDNFYTIFQAYYINFPLSDIKSIFSLFDKTSSINNKNEIYKDTTMFKIKYDELLRSLIGEMPLKRQKLVRKVFDSFNKDNNGNIMTSDIKTKFNYKNHPDVLNGKNTANEIYSDFLDFLETFREYNDNLKGGYSFTMNFEEFSDFYSEISMSIEDDNFFENMIINCWDISDENNEEIENDNSELDQNNKENINYNISENYQRKNDYNINNNNDSQNIRMRVGKQIIKNSNI